MRRDRCGSLAKPSDQVPTRTAKSTASIRLDQTTVLNPAEVADYLGRRCRANLATCGASRRQGRVARTPTSSALVRHQTSQNVDVTECH